MTNLSVQAAELAKQRWPIHAVAVTAMPTEPEHSGRLVEVGCDPLTPQFEQDEPEAAPKLTPDPTFGNLVRIDASAAEAGQKRG